MARTNPIQFIQQTRAEVAKVVWPTRREVFLTTVMVFIMATLTAIFFALVVRIFTLGRTALEQDRPYAAYVCFGIALMFSGQAFVNMGVSAGLLPTKGLTLPLISYGGTSVIVSCALLGIVLRVARELAQPAKGKKQ